jgi:protein-L-isoaspartate(D-aspartate) O-methyltransferase
MDFRRARLAMVESQIRPYGVRDPLILNAFATLPREEFVPEKQKPLAYIDEALTVVPATAGQPARALLSPMGLARMLQYVAPQQSDHALDIGGVTGYSAAILSELCGKVDALETTEALADGMKKNLAKVGADGVAVHVGPFGAGLDACKPYGVIFLNGAVCEEPRELFAQLAEGGRLMAIIRKGWQGQAWLFAKNDGAVSGRPVFDSGAEFIPGFEPKTQFVF